jgi:hypothetical protein
VGEFTPNSVATPPTKALEQDVPDHGHTLLLDGGNIAYAQTFACENSDEIRLENLTNLLTHSQAKYTDTRIYLKNWDRLRFSHSRLTDPRFLKLRSASELKMYYLDILKRISRYQYKRAQVDMTDNVDPSVQTPIVYTPRPSNKKLMKIQNKKETIEELENYPVLFRCWFEGLPYWIISHGRFFVERIGLKGIVASQEEFQNVDIYAYTIEAANSPLRPPVDKIWMFNYENQAPMEIRLGCSYTKQSIAEMEDGGDNVHLTRCPPFKDEVDDLSLLESFSELRKLGHRVSIMSNDEYRNLSKPLSYGPENRIPVNREWMSSKKRSPKKIRPKKKISSTKK